MSTLAKPLIILMSCIVLFFLVNAMTISTHPLTQLIKQRPPCKAYSFSPGQEIPHLLWNQTIHYPQPVESTAHPHMLSLYLKENNNIILPSSFFPSGFLTKILNAFLTIPLNAACLACFEPP